MKKVNFYKVLTCPFIILVLLSTVLTSCTKEEIHYPTHPTPCNGNCETYYDVIYKNELIIPNEEGYYKIEWDNLNYFQIEGSLSELNDHYVINGIPLVGAMFDSDYWIVMDTIQFQIPMYSYLGWFDDQTLNNPIPIGTYTYTLIDLIGLYPPTNIAGYQIPRHLCIECPYAPTLVGSHSKYTYTPKQNFILDNEMVGDTINVFIETIFNTDMGEREIITDNIKIIII